MKKIFEGVIVSDKMQKTVVIEVTRTVVHSLYKKLMKKSRKIKADKGDFKIVVGDRVRIEETKPFSKTKTFKILEVVK